MAGKGPVPIQNLKWLLNIELCAENCGNWREGLKSQEMRERVVLVEDYIRELHIFLDNTTS